MKNRILLALLALLPLAISCGRNGYAVFSGYAQGGTYTVIANLSGARTAEGKSLSYSEISDSIEAILTDIDTTLSGYNKKSVLSRINAGEAVRPNRRFLELLALSDKYKALSGGAVDCSAAPLFDVWGFGFKRDSLPSDERVLEALEQSRSGRKMNFNAIAQGYTADAIASFLHTLGVHDMLVDIGEIYCEGFKADGSGWKIGIDTPDDGGKPLGSSISGVWISDGKGCGVVTSGNYRKFYIVDGVKYAHTIDPRTGYPARNSMLSATVVAPNSTEADALATAFMVLGFEASRDFVLSDPSLEACFITRDSTWVSPGFFR